MTSRYTRFAGVGMAALVALCFLFPSGNGIVPESIAWADVQEALGEIQSMRFGGTRNCYFGDDETPRYKLPVEKLLSATYGYADRTYTEDGTLIIEFTFHMPSGTATVVFPTIKKYYRIRIPAEAREMAGTVTAERFFHTIWASGDYRQTEPKQVEGIEAVGFEVTDVHQRLLRGMGVDSKIADFFIKLRSCTACMWVDPKRRLPIRVDAEAEFAPCVVTGFREMRLQEVNEGFEFNVDLDEAKFKLEIPADYEQLGIPGTAPSQTETP